jgi:NAD(P)-dependent dehydrogenase (short-subunit alcohol dehydrogenase family)
MQSVVVTGVSTGIGWGIAKVMTAKGFRIFGSVRKQAYAEPPRPSAGCATRAVGASEARAHPRHSIRLAG